VSEFSYKFDNGVNVKMEQCWNQVWVQQSFAALTSADKTPLSLSTRTLGDLVSGSSFKLHKDGKEVKMQGAAPGTYDLKLNFKLSEKPGSISFIVGNVLIKPNTKTTVSVTMYGYQIIINETQTQLKGLSGFETLVNRCKGNTTQDSYFGIPTFYVKGDHSKPIPADEATGKTSGKIKPGTYDLLISIGISNQTHKIWLENMVLKPDMTYKISTNLNAGGIVYAGLNRDVNMMHLYPAGTADRQTGTPAPVKNSEIIRYDKITVVNCCSPGTYDVLLNLKNGSKYEWRKNIVIQTGTRTDVK
jgi:hypothetical protein